MTIPPSTSPPPTSNDHRRLVRITDQGKVAGVAAGLGWYFGLDPVLFRIAFVVLGLITGGAAVGIYILLWILLPRATAASSGLSAPPPSTNRSQGLAVLAIVLGVFLLGQLDVFRADVLAGAALVGIGVLLFTGGDEGFKTPGWLRAAGDPPSGGPATQPPPPAPGQAPTVPATPQAGEATAGRQATATPGAWGPVSARGGPRSAYDRPYAAAQPLAPPPRPSPRRPTRPRSILGTLTVAAWLLVMGVAMLLDRAGLVELNVVSGVGLTVLVVGAGLLVGTFFGRARWLIVVGVLGTVFLLSANLALSYDWDLAFSDGVGERAYAPETIEELQQEYRLSFGQMTLDLSELDLEGTSQRIDASLSAGELIVIVDDDVTVGATGTVGIGQYELFGDRTDGTDLDFSAEQQGVEGQGRLELDLSTNFGEIVLTHGG